MRQLLKCDTPLFALLCIFVPEIEVISDVILLLKLHEGAPSPCSTGMDWAPVHAVAPLAVECCW